MGPAADHREHSVRRAEYGRELLRHLLDGLGPRLGAETIARHLPAAREALADLGEELTIAASRAQRAA